MGLCLSGAKVEFQPIYLILTISLMESLSESEFKSYVISINYDRAMNVSC